MRERPILFSGPMVRAILEGRKTQTRRVITPQPHVTACGLQTPPEQLDDLIKAAWAAGFVDVVSPYGEGGDRLWVRETWSPHDRNGERCAPADATFVVFPSGGQKCRDGSYFNPLAEYAPGAFDRCKWRPSIHMPRWASRLNLEVTGVRVERLQEISEADALAEGIVPTEANTFEIEDAEFQDARSAYAYLWQGINGKRAPWERNPWVWVVSFKRLEPA